MNDIYCTHCGSGFHEDSPHCPKRISERRHDQTTGMSWRWDEIGGGGERWILYADNGRHMATVVRLPGTKARIFWPSAGPMTDHSCLGDVWQALCDEYGNVPPLTGVSDFVLALRSREMSPAELFQRHYPGGVQRHPDA